MIFKNFSFHRSIDTDDFSGECDDSFYFDTFNDFRAKPKVKLNIPKRVEKNYPLLRTLNDAIVITVDEMKQEEKLVRDNEVVDSQSNVVNSGNKNNSPSTSTAPVAFTFASLCVLAISTMNWL